MPAALLVLTLALARAAHAADVCGRVSVLGRPLPYGLVALTDGPSERSLARLRDGHFCLKNVAAGRYRLAVSPLGHRAPFSAAYRGLPGSLDDYHVEASSAGAAVADGVGRRLKEPGVLEVDYLPAPPAPDWAILRGELRYPPKAKPSARPRLAMVWMRERGYHFMWLAPGETSFTLSVAPGGLGSIFIVDDGYAVARLDPPYSVRGGQSHAFKTAQTAPVVLYLEPAGRVRGRVALPDGRAFAPYVGADPTRRSQLGFSLVSPFDSQQLEGWVDEEGYYEFPAVSRGVWELQPLWSGAGFLWSIGTSATGWVEPGAELAVDFTLGEKARLRVDPKGVALAPLWQTDFASHSPVIRRILGAPSGPFDPGRAFAYFLEGQLPISFNQSQGALWEPTIGGDRVFKSVAPGSYDVHLAEIRRWQDYLSVRVLASKSGVSLKPGKDASLAFGKNDYAPLGEAELRGALKFHPRWSIEDVKRTRSLVELDHVLFPVISVHDEKERFVGLSMPNVTAKDYDSLGALLAAEDWEGIMAVYSRLGEFRFQRLKPGRYRARVAAFGYPLREFDVEVRDGPTNRLDVDLDAS